MNLQNIYTFSGLAGLYKIIGYQKNGLMVENISDGRRTFVSDRGTFSCLAMGGVMIKSDKDKDDEAMMALGEVFKRMKQSAVACPSAKADKQQLMAYMKSIVSNLDEKRTHASFIQKVITWFNILDGKVDFQKEATVHQS